MSKRSTLNSTLLNSKVFITGADGFIGSHLVEALVVKGFQVRAFVQYNSFNSWGWLDSIESKTLNQIEVITGDIRDFFGVKQAMKGCDSVIHLAALVSIPYSYVAPDSYFETNTKGTLNVLQAARENQVVRFVHTSTSEVYGTAQAVPISEAHPLSGQSPYSASKIAADQVAFSYFASYGFPVVIIRPFNTYGPRQSARAIIPTIITQFLQGYKKIKLGSLSPKRDFSYVLDTVEGFINAMESDQVFGETINLGSNFEISIEETIELIATIMGSKYKIELDTNRTRPAHSEVERLWADNSKAKNLLGWTPQYQGLEGFRVGLTNTIRWFSDSKNISKYKPEIYNF